MTKFSLHKALKLIACVKLTLDDQAVLHRVVNKYLRQFMRGPDPLSLARSGCPTILKLACWYFPAPTRTQV